ncbi:uncharacterized protein LOC122002291 [Zingiber officinale]|uniref:uncharacterized protein LOC122002291 n=1 Tax=Zingiber officinale TaxID=94328 RepID=UPI001C4BA53B|nr:uncharacterized protein LOC122002291 [Zingiber officinale]
MSYPLVVNVPMPTTRLQKARPKVGEGSCRVIYLEEERVEETGLSPANGAEHSWVRGWSGRALHHPRQLGEGRRGRRRSGKGIAPLTPLRRRRVHTTPRRPSSVAPRPKSISPALPSRLL